ncbi:MAG: T9SS type A sorting domain-containing protein [Bacteroidota bacterium]
MKKYNVRNLLVLSLLVYASGGFAQSLDWNLSTGGNNGRNGLSWALGPLVEPGGEPELYWSGGESTPYSSYPVIEGDNLIVARRWPSNNQEEAWIINYNVYTGEEKWKVNIPVNTYHNFAQVSAVKDGVVYANRSGGSSEPEVLYALDIESGDIIWVSEEAIGEHATETIAFNDNGDIIAADIYRLLCFSHIDGTTLWELERNGGSSDGSSLSVFENKGYYWEQNSMGMYVAVCNLETGEYLYSSDLLGSPGFQQGGLMVGHDGTVYAPLIRGNEEMDSLHAITDKGDTLEQKWSYPIAHNTFGNHGVGPDGAVYTYSRNEEVVRLDPATGEVLNTSIVVTAGNGFFHAQMAIGDDGMVYLSVQDYPFSKLYIFTQDLEYLWGEEINGLRGVALGDSVMAINGKSNIIRAYKGRQNPGVGIPDLTETESLTVYPNPSQGIFTITLSQEQQHNNAGIDVINAAGQVVYSSELVSDYQAHLTIDITDQNNGLYIIRYFTNGKYHLQKIIKQ